MKNYYYIATSIAIAIVLWQDLKNPASAQIVPDNTLPNNSVVTQSGDRITIDEGSRAGSNLFHSFEEFGVPTGREAFFNNATTINNIITRVTGGNVSNIDGLIRANGTANLFLLNPKGIIFGPNARLDIGGSFLGTTADSVLFDDGREFSATHQNNRPLLTINVPLGLQFGSGAGKIQVTGAIVPSENAGLQVASGRTLALVGSDVSLTNATTEVRSGRLEIGSVRSGQVRLVPTTVGWQLGYDGASELGTIAMEDGTSIESVTLENHSHSGIQVQGSRIILDGSAIASVNLGKDSGGDITIAARESLELRGTSDRFPFNSLIATQVDDTASGRGGEITVSAPRITIRDGGTIQTVTFGAGAGGDLTVNASEAIELVGFNPTLLDNPFETATQLSSYTFGEADAGNITIFTQSLTVADGALVLPAVLPGARGNGGDLKIAAIDAIEVMGVSPGISAVVGNVSFGIGNGGDISIDTRRLAVRDGGQIGADTGGIGSAGRLEIHAAKSIIVSGIHPSGEEAEISADAFISDPAIQQAFSLPPVPTGNTGELTIRTGRLEVRSGGSVAVEHEGMGNAGDLTIQARAIALDSEGRITAATQSGEGGNLVLQVEDSLQLRNGSFISAEAGGTGNGGNLSISTDTLVALKNSDIIANAFEGNGGNIHIVAQAIFGTEFRPEQTRYSDITASSEFGVDGIVQITNPSIDSTQGLVELPQRPINGSDRIVRGCGAGPGNSFTLVGRGGLPPNPEQQLTGDRPWTDLRDLSAFRGTVRQSHHEAPVVQNAIVEANTWIVNDDGTIELVFDPQVHQAQIQETHYSCNGSPLNTRREN